jgi:hypothetical protein
MPDPLVDPRSLRDAIARQESRLLHLHTELGQAQARLAELKTTLAAHEGAVETSPTAPSTALEKVALFRARFRGRDDIYPRFWASWTDDVAAFAETCRAHGLPAAVERSRSGNGHGHVIVDECHHVPAASFERVLGGVKARFITGLTATPRRRDGLHPRMFKKRLRGYRAIGYDRDSGTPPRREHDDAAEAFDLAEAPNGEE